MNSLPITCKDAKTTFLLARRAERLARPLVDMTGGAWRLSITVTLGDQEYRKPWHVGIYAHYATGTAEIPGAENMPIYDSFVHNSAQLDEVIEKMRRLAVLQVLANRAGADDAND